jgi:hypothetical protein
MCNYCCRQLRVSCAAEITKHGKRDHAQEPLYRELLALPPALWQPAFCGDLKMVGFSTKVDPLLLEYRFVQFLNCSQQYIFKSVPDGYRAVNLSSSARVPIA